MKLTQYERGVGPGGVPGGVEYPLGAAVGPARVLQHLGAELGQEADRFAELDRKAENARNAVLASKLSADFAQEMAAVVQEYNPETETVQQHQDKVRAAGEASIQAKLGTIQDPVFRDIFQAHITDALTRQTEHAGVVARGKYIENTQAGYYGEIERLTAQGTPESLAEAKALTQTMTRAGILTAESGKAQDAFVQKRTMQNAFNALLMSDPAVALEAVNTKAGVLALADPTELHTFRASAQSALNAQAAQSRADQERAEKQAKKLTDAAWDSNESTLRYELRSPGALDRIRKAGWGEGGSRALSPEGERRLLSEHAALLKEHPDAESDPATKQRATLLSRSVRVSQTDREWMADQYAAGALAYKDYTAIDNEAQANMGKLKSEGEGLVGRKHAQAEQELRAKLGIPTMYDKLSPVKERVYAEALKELTDRSAFFGRGNEDPIVAVRDMLPRYQSLLLTDTELRIEQKATAARYKTIPELERAWRAGAITDKGIYDDQRRELLDVLKMQRDLLKGSDQDTTGTPPKGKR